MEDAIGSLGSWSILIFVIRCRRWACCVIPSVVSVWIESRLEPVGPSPLESRSKTDRLKSDRDDNSKQDFAATRRDADTGVG